MHELSALQIQLAGSYLEQGKLLAYPTESVWGLGCDPDNSAAVLRILQIKNRPVEKGVILVISDVSQIASLFSRLSTEQQTQLSQDHSDPITWLVPDPDNLIPSWIKGDHQTVAIRLSQHPTVQALCREFGKPIVSTSANYSGQTAIKSRMKLFNDFAGKIDFFVPGILGSEKKPSQIRDLLSGEIIR